MKTLLKLAAAGAITYAAVKAVKKYDLINKATVIASDLATRLVAAWPFEVVKDDDEPDETDEEAAARDAAWKLVASRPMQSHSSAWEGTPS